jgi:hypothetical protein
LKATEKIAGIRCEETHERLEKKFAWLAGIFLVACFTRETPR